MRDRRLDRLFLRYRSRGDVRALGEVFDVCAEELLRVAMNLVRDPVEADDLLQATFLTALQKAESWDSSRRLVPWLIGILVHHAHDQRRRRGREVDPERLVEREAEGPLDEATRIEAGESLRKAIAGLPQRYREVLQPFVEQGRRAAEIGAALGRPPGTVRMQIHRGLDLLRKALPPGLALGALVATAGPGRAAVREAVMREAARRAPHLVAGASATGTTLLGTLTMSKKVVLATVTVAALSTLAWLAAGALRNDRGADLAHVDAVEPAAETAELEASRSALETAPGETRPGAARTEAAAAEALADAGTDYDANLARLVGRLVEESGDPIAGMRVALIELGMEALDRNAADAFLAPSDRGRWILGETRTGSDGSFSLPGARPHALQGLGIDLGGERPWIRAVDVYLEPAGETDLGDVVLPGVVPTFGRVVDVDGDPLEGVRVRAGGLNDDRFDWHHFASCDADTPVIVRQNEFLSVLVELPAHVKPLLDFVPFVTATTGPDGRFELPFAPRGELRVLLDHPAFEGRLVSAEHPLDGARDMGDLVLGQGTVVSGRVVDDEGAPVAGAEVRGGGLFSLTWFGPDVAPLGARTFTDEQGDFRLTGLVEAEEHMLVARSSAEHPWVMHAPPGAGKLLISLPSRHDVAVRVQDAAGEPVDAELIAYQPSVLGALEWGALLDAKQPRGQIERTGVGRYLVRDLQKANYVLHAQAPGFAIATARLRPRERGREVVVELEAERPLTVRVLDGATDQPVGRARVGLVADRESTRVLASGESDSTGAVALSGVPQVSEDDAYLRVAHPRYATRNLPLTWAEEGSELVVRLDEGGGVVFRCRDAGQPPVAPVMFEIDLPTDSPWANDYTKRFVLSDLAGDARARHLPPGRWRWRAFERYLDNDIWQLMTTEVSSPFIGSGEVTIASGETQTVELDVTGHEFELPLPAGSASLTGRATFDGGVPPGYVILKYLERRSYEGRRLELAADGSFGADGLSAGEYELQLYSIEEAQVEGWTFTTLQLTRRVDLREGAPHHVDLEMVTTRVPIEVVDEDGEACGGAQVTLASLDPNERFGAEAVADASGQVTLEVSRAGRVRILARHTTKGLVSAEVDLVPGEGNGPYHLTLMRGARLAGTVRADPAALDVTPEAYAYHYILKLVSADDPLDHLEHFLLFDEDGDAAFDLAGLSPGLWRARIDGGHWNVSFEPFDLAIGDEDRVEEVLELRLSR